MGRNKMLLPVDGVPMVRRAVQCAIDAGVDEVIVVVGNDADAVRDALTPFTVVFAHNPDFTGPTSTSLHAGIRAVPDSIDAIAIMLADMVHTSSDMIVALTDAVQTGHAPLAVSRYEDVLAPPLLFTRPLWPELLAWHGEGCGKQVVRAHEHEAAILDWPVRALQDVDTPEDYQAITET
jgi:molybdenum cofactor cytidylyltransferase